jgi:hypothetical protein
MPHTGTSSAPTDSAATIADFETRAARIDAESARLSRSERPVAIGAGAAGVLTAWRDGTVWKRVRVEASGTGFRSVDNYWLDDGVFLGARLEVVRPGRRPAVDRVWFRGDRLYRWTNAAGRHLEPDARSTQYEVLMLRARLDSLLHALAADDMVRRPSR